MQTAAIVILNYNGKKMLERFLPSVLSNSIFPIIVADNASTDNSIEFLKSHYPQIQHLHLAENTGFAGGYNKALGQLKGGYEYYILLNSDVEVTKGWDRGLIEFLKRNTQVASVQPKITSAQFVGLFDYAGAGGGFLDELGYPYCRGRIFDSIENDLGQYDDNIEVDWSSGACMAIGASDFHDHGGFDDRFFAHMEEIDLCWRIRSSGRKIYYLGSVEVRHLGGGTLARNSPKKTMLNFRNSLLMLHKNLPKSRFLKVYATRLILDLLAMLVFVVKGKIGDVNAILKAHIGFFNIKNMYNRHSMASNLPSGSNKNIKSILWHYYVKGKKQFTML